MNEHDISRDAADEAAYDKYVKEKLARSLANPAPSIPHAEVIRKMDALINARIKALGHGAIDKPKR